MSRLLTDTADLIGYTEPGSTAEYAKLPILLSCAFWFGITCEVHGICEKPRYSDEPYNRAKQLSMFGYFRMALVLCDIPTSLAILTSLLDYLLK